MDIYSREVQETVFQATDEAVEIVRKKLQVQPFHGDVLCAISEVMFLALQGKKIIVLDKEVYLKDKK